MITCKLKNVVLQAGAMEIFQGLQKETNNIHDDEDDNNNDLGEEEKENKLPKPKLSAEEKDKETSRILTPLASFAEPIQTSKTMGLMLFGKKFADAMFRSNSSYFFVVLLAAFYIGVTCALLSLAGIWIEITSILSILMLPINVLLFSVSSSELMYKIMQSFQTIYSMYNCIMFILALSFLLDERPICLIAIIASSPR